MSETKPSYVYVVYERLNGREYIYGQAPTRYKARKVAQELGTGAKVRRELRRAQ